MFTLIFDKQYIFLLCFLLDIHTGFKVDKWENHFSLKAVQLLLPVSKPSTVFEMSTTHFQHMLCT